MWYCWLLFIVDVASQTYVGYDCTVQIEDVRSSSRRLLLINDLYSSTNNQLRQRDVMSRNLSSLHCWSLRSQQDNYVVYLLQVLIVVIYINWPAKPRELFILGAFWVMEEGNTVHVQAYFQFIHLTSYWLNYDQHKQLNTTVNTYRTVHGVLKYQDDKILLTILVYLLKITLSSCLIMITRITH